MSEYIYRVVLRSALEGRDEHQEILYCGPSLRDARIAYLRSKIDDHDDRHYRRTTIERFDAEPEEIDSTKVEELDAE